MSLRATGLLLLTLIPFPSFGQTARQEVRHEPTEPRATIPMASPKVAEPNSLVPSDRSIESLSLPPISVLGTNGLSLLGNVGYSYLGSAARLTADRVENASLTRVSGLLRLTLWMSTGDYRQNGYRTAIYTMGQLLPNTYYFNIDSGTIAFTVPPTGCYFVSMLLEELQSNGSYAYVDYVDFPNLAPINGAPCNATCALTLTATSGILPSTASSGTFYVINNPNPCVGSWTSLSDSSWLTIVSGGSGSGAGPTLLTYSATLNPLPVARTAKVTVSPTRSRGLDQTYTVTQAPGTAACTLSLSPSSASVGAGATTGTFAVNASPAGCTGSWNATSNAAWISITSGSSGSGSGTTTVTYSVTTNNSPPAQRVGTVTVADPRTRGSEQTFTVTQAPPNGPAACTANATTLCLAGGRFGVSAQWKTGGGQTGSGQAIPLTSDTGYFWFFGSSNVEMVVKVINGCGLNNRFWVFAGGLTDVNVTFSVTDTKLNLTKIYTNPLGIAFQPIQDTSAFATCP